MTVAHLAKLFGVTRGRMCLMLARAGFVFEFGPLRPVKETQCSK